MSRSGRPFLYDRYVLVSVAYVPVVLWIPQGAFAWGREGHQIVVIMAQHYMRPGTATRMPELLAPRPNAVRPYTGPRIPSPQPQTPRPRWTGPRQYIDIPLANSRIDLARECPNPDFSPPVWKGGCGCETLERGSLLPLSCPRACSREFQPRAQFPASKLACAKAAASCRTPKRAAPAQALGADTGLLQHINRNPATFAADLESRITPRGEAEWQKGSIDDWAGRIAFQTIASRGDARRSRFQNKAKMPKPGSSLRPATAS